MMHGDKSEERKMDMFLFQSRSKVELSEVIPLLSFTWFLQGGDTVGAHNKAIMFVSPHKSREVTVASPSAGRNRRLFCDDTVI